MSLVAQRYAKALLEIAREQNAADKVAEELHRFAELLGQSAELQGLLSNPAFRKDERLKVMTQLLEQLQLEKTTANFLKLLVEKGRASAIADMVQAYDTQLDEALNRVRAVVQSTRPLDEASINALKEKLETVTGKTVLVTTEVLPELMGGVVTRVGSLVFDGSVSGRLEALRDRLVRDAG